MIDKLLHILVFVLGAIILVPGVGCSLVALAFFDVSDPHFLCLAIGLCCMCAYFENIIERKSKK